MTLLPPSQEDTHNPFVVGDCSLMTIATGTRAQNLRDFHDGLAEVPDASLTHHFWGRLLSPRFDEPEFSNDFASWVYWCLHEKALAERLSAIDPSDHDTEALRHELLEVVEHTLDRSDHVPWARSDQLFYFLRGKIVVFDSGLRIHQPSELGVSVARMSTSSVYYHFIDARHRTEDRSDDFSTWLAAWGEEFQPLRQRIHAIDPFFSSLKEIKRMILEVCVRSDLAGRDDG
jgi:hypothetical protein